MRSQKSTPPLLQRAKLPQEIASTAEQFVDRGVVAAREYVAHLPVETADPGVEVVAGRLDPKRGQFERRGESLVMKRCVA